MATRIRNDAPEGDQLEYGDIVIPGGAEALVDDEVAEALLTDPHVEVSLVEEEVNLSASSREELNALAKELGIEGAEELANKDAVIAAIENHQPTESAEQEPEADGEGQTTDTKENE